MRSSVVETDKGPNEPKQKLAIKKVTNVFSKKILAKRALREIKLLQHFRGHRNVRCPAPRPAAQPPAFVGNIVNLRAIGSRC